MEIKVEENNVVIGLNNGYNATINWNLSLMSQGVTSVALAAATITNGEIVISATSNTVLYKLLTSNLFLMIDVDFED